MSLRKMASGDSLTFYTISDPGFGASLTSTARITKEGRVDTFSSNLDTIALKSDEVRHYTAYFHSDNNPSAKIGEYARWTTTGGGTAVSPVRVMRVVGAYSEGRPGSVPLVYIVEFAELTAEAAGALL